MPFDLRDSRLLEGPGVEGKADRQFFRTHTDEESQAFSSSVSAEDDGRFLRRLGRSVTRVGLVVEGNVTRADPALRASFYSNLGSTPDGRRALVGRIPAAHSDPRKGAVCILDLPDGRVIRLLSQDDGWICPIATLSPDGSLLAAIRMWGKEPVDWRYSLVIRDATSGKEVHEFEKRATPVWAIGFVPGGPPWRILTADSDFHITLWDDTTGRQIWSVPVDSFVVAFSPDRALAVSAQGGDAVDIRTGGVSPGTKLKLWDTARGKPFRTLLDADADRLREIQEKEWARRERAGEPR
jgi:WD40 repeat protein